MYIIERDADRRNTERTETHLGGHEVANEKVHSTIAGKFLDRANKK